MKLRIRVLGLDGEFQQLAAIGGKQGGGVASAETLTPMRDRNLVQGVEIAAPCPGEGNLTAEK